MINLRNFQGIFCLLYIFLLVLEEAKCGSKRDLFDCTTVHLCECGLIEEYNKCWNLSPAEAKERAQDIYAEFFPGENTLDQDLNSFKFELCSNTNVETVSKK
ncbi:hypothetical protein TNCT_518261 [Trichonephila clavata]|uniref:Uncharacterized protein n=1 Tax=Trichonephila clavata TaxID=2740835 RepID=A0A8X6I494_TRICU|nr:hypothetical protein TNCT_518261 [Trichonephila clavata]